jgi:hypothetical protein
MPSQDPNTLRQLADAVDSVPLHREPPAAREAERIRRDRAALRYLERLADEQIQTQLRSSYERFKG